MRPVLFHLGELAVPSYLFLLVLGTSVFVGLTLRAVDRQTRLERRQGRARLGRRRGVDIRRTALLLGAVWIAAVIGARLLFVLKNPSLRADPLRWIFDPSPGGYAIQGGVVLALLIAVVLARWLRLPLATIAMAAVPGLFVAGAAGRLGCFLAGCCYGQPTSMPWGVIFPATSEPSRHWGAGVALHPTQLYEAAFFVVLAVLYTRTVRRASQTSSETKIPGATFIWLLIAYFTFRFVVESFRGDPRMVLWGLTSPQWISVGVVAFALLVLQAHRRTRDASLQEEGRVASAPADRRWFSGFGHFELPFRGATIRSAVVRSAVVRSAVVRRAGERA